MTSSDQDFITLPYRLAERGELEDPDLWKKWRDETLDMLKDQRAIILREPSGVFDYDGTFLLRHSDTEVYWIDVTDYGWECDEPGETDSDGNVTREASGSNDIETVIINLRTEVPKAIHHKEQYREDQIPGLGYAIMMALKANEDLMGVEHLWDFALSHTREIVG